MLVIGARFIASLLYYTMTSRARSYPPGDDNSYRTDPSLHLFVTIKKEPPEYSTVLLGRAPANADGVS